jgi:pimeloyl-ACP methyl ester carboxylesterase
VSAHDTAIVFVHGLWLTGVESTFLRRRLATDLDCAAHTFRYPSVSASMTDILQRLAAFAAQLEVRTLHFIGHSLGGIVLLRFFNQASELPPGRVVLLGSPVRGSLAARNVARWPLAAAVMGRNVDAEVLEPRLPRWNHPREIGVIAGDLSLGLGRLFGELGGPNDGTICVEETELPGATDRIVLPVSHTGLLFSADVAHQTAAFLANGRFDARPSA